MENYIFKEGKEAVEQEEIERNKIDKGKEKVFKEAKCNS